MIESLTNLITAIKFADILDIAFISVLLYGVLTWFRETTSRSVYIGLSLLTLVYFFARAFNMYMTTMLFQAVFAVLVVALIVVFQEDLRRFFARLSALGSFQDPRKPGDSFTYIDTLVSTLADFASKRIGCLIVLTGIEPLDRHIDGGIDLDGQISKPLLDSIFDPHSLGHDGAAVIERDRIKKFGVLLPISKNLKELGIRGARHSAALGLSEVSDALICAVSEERSQISVARRGRLRAMSSASELQACIEQFSQEIYPSSPPEFWRRLVKEHAALKAVSVALACIAWSLTSYGQGMVQQTFFVPIELRNAPSDVVFEDLPSEVNVTLSGRERAFAMLLPGSLKVSLDLANVGEGTQQFPIDDADVKRPAEFSVSQINPHVLQFAAHSLVLGRPSRRAGNSRRTSAGAEDQEHFHHAPGGAHAYLAFAPRDDQTPAHRTD